MTECQNLGYTKLMGCALDRAHKYNSSQLEKNTYIQHVSMFEIMTDTQNLANHHHHDGKRFSPFAKVVLITASKNHLLSKCSYKLLKKQTIIEVKKSKISN